MKSLKTVELRICEKQKYVLTQSIFWVKLAAMYLRIMKIGELQVWRRSGAGDGHDGHFCGLFLVLRALPRPAQHRTTF
jgi:hypothetical protein